ncbi:MAG: PqiC family protein [Pseudomonadota bacterium]
MRPIIHTLVIGLCLVLLTGCGVTKPSRFYLLTPVEENGAGTVSTPAPALGIGPVAFPAYLDRTEIVLRSGGNQLHYAESHRWAEPLKTAFSHTLSENLSIMLPTDRTVIHPWSRSTVLDYQVIVNVTRFDADAGGTVILTAAWEIIRTSDSKVTSQNKATYTEVAGSIDYPVIVAAQSRAVERLSRNIAEVISRAGLPAGQSR